MKVADVMTKDVVTVTPDTTLKETARLLVERNISGVPVLEARGQVVGIVSETDILYKELDRKPKQGVSLRRLLGISGRESSRKLDARIAGEVMSSPPIVAYPSTSIAEAAGTMVEQDVDRVVVVNLMGRSEGELAGIVTKGDLVRAFARGDEAIAKEIKSVIERFEWEYSSSPGSVRFRVRDGEVTLDGSVELKWHAESMEHEVARLPGVMSLRSNLSWQAIEPQTGGPRFHPPGRIQTATQSAQRR